MLHLVRFPCYLCSVCLFIYLSFLLPWDTGCWWYKRVGRLSPCPKRAASCPGSAVRLLQVPGRSLSTRWGWPFSAGSPTGPVVPWHLIQVNLVFAFIGVNYLPLVGFWASPILCEFSKYFLLKYGCCKCSSMVSVLHLPETKFKKKQRTKHLSYQKFRMVSIDKLFRAWHYST